ncbi:MAG: TetR/AcrR family transcriptional regulator [Clostridiales bacterium]|nr:TetR/AcrR family transcriptional regulator [Clostridiales bacterium]
MDDTGFPKKISLKSARIRSYFIEAAKEIIMRDGVENVSVRKVANLAGYSYATIYNYFSDLNQLLQETKLCMIRDVIVYMGSVQGEKVSNLDEVKRINRMYALYYLEHPHVFRFFYSYRLTNELKVTKHYFDYEASWHNTYQCLVTDGTIREEDVSIVGKTIIYALHGLLALFFSDNGLTHEALFSELDQLTGYLLKRRDSL